MVKPHDKEIEPPWVLSRSLSPGDDPYWHASEGRDWLAHVFLPFYDALPASEQTAYCERWSAPNAWITQFLHPDLDALFAEADSEDHPGTPAALDYRKILLGK